jgi:hypothetical protein
VSAPRLAWLLALALVGLPRLALGQAEPASPRATLEQEDPTTWSDAELEAAGWRYSRQRANPGSPGAGIFALTLGLPVHGSGHFLVGDRRTGWRLLGMQGASLGVFATGAAMWHASEGAGARMTGSTLQALGASVFVASWLADVLGATKGSGADLPANTYRAGGLSAEFGFATLIGEGAPATTTFRIALPFDARRFVLRPDVELGTDFDAQRFGIYAGWRVPTSKRPSSFVEFGAGGFDEWFGDAQVGRTQVRGTVRWSYDFGDGFRHLANLVWVNDVSVATDYAMLRPNDRFRRSQRSIHVPFGFVVHTNLDQGVNLALGYRHDRDRWVGTLGRRAGSVTARLGIVPRNRLGIELEGEQGAYTRAVIGLRYVIAGR